MGSFVMDQEELCKGYTYLYVTEIVMGSFVMDQEELGIQKIPMWRVTSALCHRNSDGEFCDGPRGVRDTKNSYMKGDLSFMSQT